MNRRQLLASSGAAALALPFGSAADAAQLTSVRVERNARLPLVRPDWPVPDDPNQKFFIQRSTNANTLVFAVNYNGDGSVSQSDPSHIYWRRYASNGARKPLKPIERLIAGAIQVRKRPEPDAWDIIVRPMQRLNMVVIQTGPHETQLIGHIGGVRARPIYCYADVDESGLIPRVTALSMHGLLPGGGAISEYYSVAGGQIR
ncbi:DUF4833 domain-containing protein [Psychromarinibacter sp. C21-152]|uniref:DUF4833 domain-containing protein n=1 Tax=Psychromarinibacter sediminicola TaxID=3033385 RepID=A0AAE3NQ38_9RHOB|nr:DUF4833 domain-containing protein [Psychromarinibacter sediminicola]MDF0600026.1 DUF4833 domain-containing protein [Psychromarinibacter sediminicola]